MKAYKIKITLIDSNPLIWRKVIVPSEITFKRLHDVIQFSMGWRDEHYYDFDIKDENLKITNDEEAIAEYKFYSNKKLTKKNDPYGYIANKLKTTPKLSTRVKIDKYMIKEKPIEYIYDFGDYWKHEITLEEVVENYEHGYPTCIDGEGACPPEDVGGVHGYEMFLEVINNKNHPDYEHLRTWAEEQYYNWNFDIEKINFFMADILKLKKIKK